MPKKNKLKGSVGPGHPTGQAWAATRGKGKKVGLRSRLGALSESTPVGAGQGTQFYKKIQRQANLGNQEKAKHLTWEYRQRVATRENNPLVAKLAEKKLKRWKMPGAPKGGIL